MKKHHRDDAYWTDAFWAFYVDGNFGKYAEVHERFKAEHPDYRAHLARTAADRVENTIEKEIVKRVTRRFAEADRQEQVPAPTPHHLRQVCLPFDIAVPPMSQSVNAFDGHGRLAMLDASPKQQKRHQTNLKQFHREGFVYREQNEAAQVAFLDQLKQLLPDVEMLGDLPMRQIIELLEKLTLEAEDETSHAAPPPAL